VGDQPCEEWTVTSFLAADIVDTFAETTCAGGMGYIFNGTCIPYNVRIETIKVKGGETVLLPGESGFIQDVAGAPVLDPHFNDQLGLAKNLDYKPIHLFINSRLKK
jgi:acyl-homoserine lactone acylase PvdQ